MGHLSYDWGGEIVYGLKELINVPFSDMMNKIASQNELTEKE